MIDPMNHPPDDGFIIRMNCDTEVKITYGKRPIHTLNCDPDYVCIYMTEPPYEFKSWYVRLAKWIELKINAPKI